MVLAVFVVVPSAWSFDDLTQRFEREAPRAWARYRSFADRLQGSYTMEFSRDRQLVNRMVTEVKQNEHSRLVIYQHEVNADAPRIAQSGIAAVHNSLYSFSLRRSGATSPWVIADINHRREGELPNPIQDAENRNIMAAMLTLTYAKSLEELLAQPTFRLVGVAETVHDGTRAVSFKFVNVHELNERPFFPVQGGTIVLDPTQSWCVRSAELDCLYANGRARERVDHRYRASADGFAMPLSKTIAREFVDETGELMRGTLVNRFKFDVVQELPDDSEFTLSAFGFPEPDFARKGSNLYVWLGAAGIVCLVTAIVLRKLLRRRSTAQ
jgi:hypothetical protein